MVKALLAVSSKGPVNLFMVGQMKYQVTLNKNLTASIKKIQLGYDGFFQQDIGPPFGQCCYD